MPTDDTNGKEANNPCAEKILRGQTEALVRHLDERCVGLIGFQGDTPVEIGSGTCVTIGGRFFVATAAHVIEDYANADIFIVHTRTPKPAEQRVPIIGRGLRGGKSVDPVDVAFLEISGESATTIGKTFVPLERLEPFCPDLPRDLALVYGYPSEKIDPELLQQRKVRLQPLGYMTPTIDPASLSRDRNFDVYLAYPAAGNQVTTGEELDKLPAAPGISGGGIWAAHVNEPGLWSPDKCKLIAIERSWLKYEWVRGTQIQHWLDLVAAEIPELRSLIGPLLQPPTPNAPAPASP